MPRLSSLKAAPSIRSIDAGTSKAGLATRVALTVTASSVAAASGWAPASVAKIPAATPARPAALRMVLTFSPWIRVVPGRGAPPQQPAAACAATLQGTTAWRGIRIIPQRYRGTALHLREENAWPCRPRSDGRREARRDEPTLIPIVPALHRRRRARPHQRGSAGIGVAAGSRGGGAAGTAAADAQRVPRTIDRICAGSSPAARCWICGMYRDCSSRAGCSRRWNSCCNIAWLIVRPPP